MLSSHFTEATCCPEEAACLWAPACVQRLSGLRTSPRSSEGCPGLGDGHDRQQLRRFACRLLNNFPFQNRLSPSLLSSSYPPPLGPMSLEAALLSVGYQRQNHDVFNCSVDFHVFLDKVASALHPAFQLLPGGLRSHHRLAELKNPFPDI